VMGHGSTDRWSDGGTLVEVAWRLIANGRVMGRTYERHNPAVKLHGRRICGCVTTQGRSTYSMWSSV
jgi:hypothetical protein